MDLSIEQILMKLLKGRSGVVAEGITENVLNVWTKTMHRCAEISEAMDTVVSTKPQSAESTKHKEMFSARIKRDYEDFHKIKVNSSLYPLFF